MGFSQFVRLMFVSEIRFSKDELQLPTKQKKGLNSKITTVEVLLVLLSNMKHCILIFNTFGRCPETKLERIFTIALAYFWPFFQTMWK